MSNRGYSVDFRQRVVKACDGGMTEEEAAELFGVGPATVYRWKALRRETGALEPRPHGGGNPSPLDEQRRKLLADIVHERPDRTLDELTAELVNRVGGPFSVSASSVSRAVLRLRLTRKKKSSPRSRRTGRT